MQTQNTLNDQQVYNFIGTLALDTPVCLTYLTFITLFVKHKNACCLSQSYSTRFNAMQYNNLSNLKSPTQNTPNAPFNYLATILLSQYSHLTSTILHSPLSCPVLLSPT
jgi:hypothetical protein